MDLPPLVAALCLRLFEHKSDGPATPQIEQERYAAACAAIGRFLSKIDPTHATVSLR
jgi:hypothetical protein